MDNLADGVKVGKWIFNEIRLRDIDIYAEYIKSTEYPANLWSSNFAYLYAISQSSQRKVLWKIVDDMLVTFIYSIKGSLYLYCLPFGRGGADKICKVLEKCLGYCLEVNGQDQSRTMVKMINDSQLNFLRQNDKFDKIFRLVTWQGIERHYDIKKLVSLSGPEFSNIRNRINKFKRENSKAQLSRYDGKTYDELMNLNEKWKNTSGKKYSNILDGVYYQELVKNYSELRQIILTVKLDEEIIGMISGSLLPTGQSWGSVVKFKDGISGLSETLIFEFAKEINRIDPKAELLNVGSDLGEKGLRDYKLKFCPVLNLKRYQVFLRQQETPKDEPTKWVS